LIIAKLHRRVVSEESHPRLAPRMPPPACRQVPRRVPAPPWLKALLVIVHVTPLMLLAASSSLGTQYVELLVERPVPTTLGALGLLVVSSMLVYATVIDPLCRRVQTQKKFLPPRIGIKKETDHEWLFRMWMRRKFAAAQTVLLIVWACWWNFTNPLGPGVEWGSRWYNGLVPNLVACMACARTILRSRHADSFIDDDMDMIDLMLSWACAVAIPAVNTAAFLAGADPARRSRQIDLEVMSGPAMYATFMVTGCALSMQPFSLRSKLKLLVGNFVAVTTAGLVRATYSSNWNEMVTRRHVLCSIWAGFALAQLVIDRAIWPYWLQRREFAVVRLGV